MGESTWAIIMISIAIGMGLYFLIFKRNYPYTLVVVWARYGIYLKRSAAEEVEAGIVLTTQIGMALCVASMSYLFFNKFMNPNQ
jgi:nitrate reductase gamma subunit